MPANSPSQQRLFGIAYSVKKGDTKLTELDDDLQGKIKSMIESMSLKKLKEYASTKHDEIDESDATTSNTPGMGSASFPTDSSVGSGDTPGNTVKGEIYTQTPSKILSFDEFINRSKS